MSSFYKQQAGVLAKRAGSAVNKSACRVYATLSEHHNPIPALKYNGQAQHKGSPSSPKRWQLIQSSLPDIATAVDIGCNTGYFAFHLAQRGVLVHAFEPNADLADLAWIAASHPATGGRISLGRMPVDRETIHFLPEVDCVVLMSVMHYWVDAYGWSVAWTMLSEIWNRTRAVMYFEIPNPVQNTKMSSVLSFMGSTDAECEAFLSNALSELCGAQPELLGYIQTDYRGEPEKRHLFMVRRC